MRLEKQPGHFEPKKTFWHIEHDGLSLNPYAFKLKREAQHFLDLIAPFEKKIDAWLARPGPCFALGNWFRAVQTYVEACEDRDHAKHPTVYSEFPSVPAFPE